VGGRVAWGGGRQERKNPTSSRATRLTRATPDFFDACYCTCSLTACLTCRSACNAARSMCPNTFTVPRREHIIASSHPRVYTLPRQPQSARSGTAEQPQASAAPGAPSNHPRRRARKLATATLHCHHVTLRHRDAENARHRKSRDERALSNVAPRQVTSTFGIVPRVSASRLWRKGGRGEPRLQSCQLSGMWRVARAALCRSCRASPSGRTMAPATAAATYRLPFSRAAASDLVSDGEARKGTMAPWQKASLVGAWHGRVAPLARCALRFDVTEDGMMAGVLGCWGAGGAGRRRSGAAEEVGTEERRRCRVCHAGHAGHLGRLGRLGRTLSSSFPVVSPGRHWNHGCSSKRRHWPPCSCHLALLLSAVHRLISARLASRVAR
jgi:hypothetical protein